MNAEIRFPDDGYFSVSIFQSFYRHIFIDLLKFTLRTTMNHEQ